MKRVRYFDKSGNAHQTDYTYNYTPSYPDNVLPNPPQLPVTWNVAAAMGVRVNGRNWDSTACILGDISHTPPESLASICSDAFQGNSGPGLLFGVAGAPLLRTFQVSARTDSIQFGASLDNVGVMSVQNEANSLDGALGDGIQAFGGIVQLGGAAIALETADLGALVSGIGTVIAVIGSLVSVDADLNQQASVRARRNCLGGILGNPPSGSTMPQDTVMTTITGSQLYEGTQNGPLFLIIPTQMNYASSDPPWGFGACQAATNVVFMVDRPRNPATVDWSDGLAVQSRSPDSAVVRRRNAVESFRVDPIRQRIEHDSWRYAPFELTLDPSDGLAVCNGPGSCSPRAWAEPVNNYIASAADPSMQQPPIITNVSTPLTALSPDPSQLVLFFVDDNGNLYVSAANYRSNDVSAWRTWLVTGGLPANAPLTAIRSYPENHQYMLFWVGTDGAVHTAAIANSDTQPQLPVTLSQISGSISLPGAAIAAVERTPQHYEVFVVGRHDITLLSNATASSVWSASSIGPTTNQVAFDSPIAAVATSTNNLDLFFFDTSHALQHVAFTTQLVNWAFDSNFPHLVASTGTRQLSAVSRAPNNIDVIASCDAVGLCNVSITNANNFPNMLSGAAPAVSLPGVTSADRLSIVAASSTALDVVGGSGQSAFDTSWQLGALSWSTTAPLATCDAGTCWSFNMSVAPTFVSIAANDSVSVHLLTTLLNDSGQISLTFSLPSGVVAGVFDPTTVAPGQAVDLGFAVPLGTPPGNKGPITIVGTNGIETHSVMVDVTTTACAPTTCQAENAQCGSLSDMCGHAIRCGSCRPGLVCSGGLCLTPRCARGKPCPKGFVWDSIECQCVSF